MTVFRYYKADAEQVLGLHFPTSPGDDEAPPFTFVALHNDKDPDANGSDGLNYFGAHGDDGDVIDTWAATQPLVPIDKSEVLAPITFHPHPFES